jgi:hypothetical protein
VCTNKSEILQLGLYTQVLQDRKSRDFRISFENRNQK